MLNKNLSETTKEREGRTAGKEKKRREGQKVLDRSGNNDIFNTSFFKCYFIADNKTKL